MNRLKPRTEEQFPLVMLSTINGQQVALGKPGHGLAWQLIIIYRGHHSPSCTDYLNQLNQYKDQFAAIDIDLIAASADNSEQLQQHLPQLSVSYPLAFGLSIEHMYQLNLHVSVPKDLQETNHPFAEPALFLVDDKGRLVLSDIADNPLTRPCLPPLLTGLQQLTRSELG
ncbi:MAG: redoxin family protein [Gammaproteobacteria bacterium]|nr:redoxin family protein [Gammaproteobacteria bacterium]